MNRVLAFLVLVAVSACSAFEGEQKTNVNDIIKTHEIRQLNNAEVIIESEKYGTKLYSMIDSLVQEKALDCHSILAGSSSWMDSLSQKIGGKISLGVSVNDFKTKQEKELFEAYEYNYENGIENKTSIQRMDDQYVLFNFAVSTKDSNYESCLSEVQPVAMWSFIIPVKTVIISLD